MNVVLLPGAERDLLDAIEWYGRVSANLGDQFEVEFYQAIDRIVENPESFAENSSGFRPCLTKRFTSVVYFRIDEKVIVIVRILVNGREDQSVAE